MHSRAAVMLPQATAGVREYLRCPRMHIHAGLLASERAKMSGRRKMDDGTEYA